jgi:hypothetical protein
MSIEIAWDNETQTVIRVDFVRKWDWEEYHQMVSTLSHMIDDVGYQVDIIYNLQQSAPLSSGAITHGAATLRLLDGKFGVLLVVSSAGYVKAILSTFRTVYKQWSDCVIGATSVEEARVHITQNAGKGG